MKVKIDTKEKFHVLTINEPILSANMTEGINEQLLTFLNKGSKSVILKLAEVKEIDAAAATALINLQQIFYKNNASFVICEISPAVKQSLEKTEILELLNTTNTESEAWDIIQMEEIERELME